MVLDYETEIEMLLFDMDKIVTYKEINNRFNLTPKEAQNVLNEFIENRRKSTGKKSQFNIIYVLILQDKEKKAKKITLCNENEVDKWKENYTIMSKQVYSIQARAINDFNLIYSNDVDASNNVQRKSNLKLVFNMNEPQQENMVVDPKQENDKVKLSKLSLNDQHNVLKPSKESNIQNSKDKDVEMLEESERHKDIHVKKEKEMPKLDVEKVKHEPKQPTEDVNTKKIKLESEHHANEPKQAAGAKSTAKKAEPASKTGAKAANQATLTSFFKKK